MKNAALIPCRGLGDGIIFTIAANYLKSEGFRVTIFHDALLGLQPWLPDFSIQPEDAFHEEFARILYQNENAPRAKKFRALPSVEILYHNHECKKHPPLRSKDVLIGTKGPIAASLAKALGVPCKSGLSPPKNLTYKKHPKRIAIHPTSADSSRNWPREKFECLAKRLQEKGFDPQFVMSAKERWSEEVPLFSSLTETAQFLFESGGFIGNDSGLGHLASALGLPTVTLSNRRNHISLWRPSFCENRVVVPSALFPKGYREKQWKKLIKVKNVCNTISELL